MVEHVTFIYNATYLYWIFSSFERMNVVVAAIRRRYVITVIITILYEACTQYNNIV